MDEAQVFACANDLAVEYFIIEANGSSLVLHTKDNVI
jgi:hypothetical protein